MLSQPSSITLLSWAMLSLYSTYPHFDHQLVINCAYRIENVHDTALPPVQYAGANWFACSPMARGERRRQTCSFLFLYRGFAVSSRGLTLLHPSGVSDGVVTLFSIRSIVIYVQCTSLLSYLWPRLPLALTTVLYCRLSCIECLE